METNPCCGRHVKLEDTSYGWIIKCEWCKRQESIEHSFVDDNLKIEELIKMWNSKLPSSGTSKEIAEAKERIHCKVRRKRIEKFLDRKAEGWGGDVVYHGVADLIEEYLNEYEDNIRL